MLDIFKPSRNKIHNMSCSLMVTTKEKNYSSYTKDCDNKSKHIDTKSHQIRKEDSKRRNKEQRIYNIEHNKMATVSSDLSLMTLNINELYYIIYLTKRHRNTEWIKKQNQCCTTCKRFTLLKDTHWNWKDGKKYPKQIVAKS